MRGGAPPNAGELLAEARRPQADVAVEDGPGMVFAVVEDRTMEGLVRWWVESGAMFGPVVSGSVKVERIDRGYRVTARTAEGGCELVVGGEVGI